MTLEIEDSHKQVLNLVVPAKAEYLSLVRLVVAAAAKDQGFTDESVADIKVALSEASTNVVKHAYAGNCAAGHVIQIACFEEPDRFVVDVLDYGRGMPLPPPASEGGLGFGIMGSLMDKVDVETGDTGTTVHLAKSFSTSRHAA